MATLQQRQEALIHLGNTLRDWRSDWADQAVWAKAKNGWFSESEVRRAAAAWAAALLPSAVRDWSAGLPDAPPTPRKVGLIGAGNLPLVALHDVLSVYASGHPLYLKPSSDDAVLLPHAVEVLREVDPDAPLFRVERLNGMDAVLATGSSNSRRYFDAYFGHLPHVFRGTRHSAAVLNAGTTPEHLAALGHDVFDYYGLGCRSVSHLCVPQDFDIQRVFAEWMPFAEVVNHHKYGNNYDYHRALFMLNQDPFLENGFVLFRESEALASPVAVLHWHRYADEASLRSWLEDRRDQLQCLVVDQPQEWTSFPAVAFGQTQAPGLTDYADGLDVLAFLRTL